jgi:hypothetical protein
MATMDSSSGEPVEARAELEKEGLKRQGKDGGSQPFRNCSPPYLAMFIS